MKLKNVDKNIAETILNEILDTGPTVTFKDIGECRQVPYMYNKFIMENLEITNGLNEVNLFKTTDILYTGTRRYLY